ncbi:hypothetical protein ACFVTY_22330 [Streptomyces sp. NPDC058067]|uniref:hypothetical protein n=1 Tax=Streptomyces sp. NPDC058067 TaxID=3346324 RepID=UPI0036E93A43
MAYIQALAGAGDDFRYAAGLLNSLHFMLQGHHLDKRPDRRRDGPVYVSSPDDSLAPASTAPDRLPAFSDAKVRRTVHQQDADLSGDQQTIRDIRELVARGRLIPHGKARARRYAPGPLMNPVREEIRQSMEPYTDPYRRTR